MLLLALVFCTGNIWSIGYKILAAAVFVFTIIVYFVSMTQERRRALFFAAACMCIFVTAIYRYTYTQQFYERCENAVYNKENVVLYGKVYKTEYKNESYRYYMTDCTLAAKGDTLRCMDVIVYSEDEYESVGCFVKAEGNVSLFSTATNEGQFDIKSFYRTQQIVFSLNASKLSFQSGRFTRFENAVMHMRNRLSHSLEAACDSRTAGILSSMLFGDKTLLEDEVKQLYQRSGISHILAISGLHISIVGMALYKLIRKLGIGFKASMVVCTGTILIYGFMTGNAVSTQRAIGMFILTMIAAAIGRASDMLNSLGIMVMYILFDNPFAMEYSGFIFSVTAILSIGIIVSAYELKIDTDSQDDEITGYKKFLNDIKEKIWAGAAIQIPSLPLVACFYYEIPVFSVLVNLIVLPFLSVVFMSGLLAAFIGLRSLWVSKAAVFPAWFILKCYEILCDKLSSLSVSMYVTGKPSTGKWVTFYIILSCFALLLHICRRYGKVKLQKLFRASASILCIAVLLWPKSKGMELDFLDVGQGDGIYYQTDDEKNIFIDGGSTSKNNLGENIIMPFLKSKGISAVDYWFVSHADEDHISAINEVIENGYSMKNLVVSKTARKNDDALEELCQKAEAVGISIIELSQGDKISFSDETTIKCLYPGNEDVSDDRNDMSLVLRLDNYAFSAIFAGDIASETEKYLVEQDADLLDVDIYKANHHGSKYSNASEWLNAISPKISVISCSSTNLYGHPADEAIENIKASGSQIYYTMYDGQIKINEFGVVEDEEYR